MLALRLRGTGSLNDNPEARTTWRWLLVGLLWGLIALLNATPLAFLPACVVWLLWRTWKTQALGAILAALVFCTCLAPWIVRNYKVFHTLIPMRGNLGAELYQSVQEEYQGFPWGTTVPLSSSDPAYQRYKSMGEVAYVKQQGTLAHRYIALHLRRFFELACKRFYFFWAGVPHPVEKSVFVEVAREINFSFLSVTGLLGLALSLKNRTPGTRLFLCAFMLIPLPYYFITVQARFRHPLEPLITIFTVYLFRSADRTRAWSIFGEKA